MLSRFDVTLARNWKAVVVVPARQAVTTTLGEHWKTGRGGETARVESKEEGLVVIGVNECLRNVICCVSELGGCGARSLCRQIFDFTSLQISVKETHSLFTHV